MRILTMVLLFFVSHIFVSGQAIFTPFEGEKKIMKIEDIKNLEKRLGAYGGELEFKACGDYFLYAVQGENKSIFFRPTLARNDGENYDHASTISAFFDMGSEHTLAIQLDDSAKVPTARWHQPSYSFEIIRISNKDYKKAACLPKPNKLLLDKIK